MLYSQRMGSPTKTTILNTLRSQGKCTVKELAEAAQVTPISVRHHLAGFQAEGLVTVEEARHGVGRPLHLFSLTERGQESFPRRYYRLTNHILRELKGSLSEKKVHEIFSSIAMSMVDDYANDFDGLPLKERIENLQALLQHEGFETEIERKDDQILIHELNCPYFQIGQSHPEICVIDQTFIANTLAVPVERVSCILEGDRSCTFCIQLDDEGGA
jgi:DeoR family suf operon transcriptional repressor